MIPISSPEPLPERLIQFRTLQNLTREEFASILGVRPITVLRWETGTSLPGEGLADRLMTIGFGSLARTETKAINKPRIGLQTDESKDLRSSVRSSISFAEKSLEFTPAPYVVNGPENQLAFFESLYELQDRTNLPYSKPEYARRLSLVAEVPELNIRTAQAELEGSKSGAAHWNPNYGSHGWHRYIGRFPPHLVRAFLNHFGARRGDVICDPFSGSGTTLVEARLLGMKAIGVEICPLSALIGRTKSTFPNSSLILEQTAKDLAQFYERTWTRFIDNARIDEINHDTVLTRSGNPIPRFTNVEKWMTVEALLGTSIVVEFAMSLKGYAKDALCCALSASMRSIGNLDVDVVRAEYSKTPRLNVDVLKLVLSKLRKMRNDVERMVLTHRDLMSTSKDIEVIEASVLEARIPSGEVDFIITSPPYGVESVSYLRTHLLSYRCLQPVLGYDPYQANSKIIGSEYISQEAIRPLDNNIAGCSPTFVSFFEATNNEVLAKKEKLRRDMMVQFFDDMMRTGKQMYNWLRVGGKAAFVIGNKRLGNDLIPANEIIGEMFEHLGFKLESSIQHKLKCNNSNSEVPWQERTIQDEFAMVFSKS